jgi:hypothetical protein
MNDFGFGGVSLTLCCLISVLSPYSESGRETLCLPCLWLIPEIRIPAICRSIRNGKTASFIKRMLFLFQEGFLPLAGFPGNAENASLAYSPAYNNVKSSPVNTGCFLWFHMKL